MGRKKEENQKEDTERTEERREEQRGRWYVRICVYMHMHLYVMTHIPFKNGPP